MIAESEMLKYGALGFGFLVLSLTLWLIVRPIILSFVAELEASRQERVVGREQFLDYMQNHAAKQLEAMHQVKEGLREETAGLREVKDGLSQVTMTLRRLNGHSEQET